MLKLLICLFCTTAMALMMLELRQQRLNLLFETNLLHNRLSASQAELWNQQLNIAISTSPNALAATVKGDALKLTAPKSGTQGKFWADDKNSDAAE